MGWVGRHAVTDAARDLMTRQTNSVTTVLLGRRNYQGFGHFWPTVATSADAHPRDRTYAQWLDSVEKVALSTTTQDAFWQNSRIVADDPATVVRELRRHDGGDIAVLNSVSVINQLLHAGELDQLWITFCPEVVGGGARFFQDALPATSWSLTDMSTSETGAMCLYYAKAGKQD